MTTVVPDLDAVMKMVRHYARRYRNTPLGYEDAVGEGYLSLVESALHYDKSLGIPFIAYAGQNVGWALSSAHRGAGCRKRNMARAKELAFESWFFEKIEDPAGLGTRLLDIAGSVGHLKPQQMAVLAMHVAGYDIHETARVLQVRTTRISHIFKDIRERVLDD